MEGRSSQAWAYTIGLVDLNHPELVVMGMAPEMAGTLLNRLAIQIRDGSKFLDGEEVTVGRKLYEFASVSDRHFENDTFAMWLNYYGALGPPHPEPRALEVVPQGQPRKLS